MYIFGVGIGVLYIFMYLNGYISSTHYPTNKTKTKKKKNLFSSRKKPKKKKKKKMSLIR